MIPPPSRGMVADSLHPRFSGSFPTSTRYNLQESRFLNIRSLGDMAMRTHVGRRGTIRIAVLVTLLAGLVTPARSAAQSAAGEREVTFTKDIAPILQRSCQHCHQPDSVAPMSLITYQEVRPWARAIKMRTTCSLPRQPEHGMRLASPLRHTKGPAAGAFALLPAKGRSSRRA